MTAPFAIKNSKDVESGWEARLNIEIVNKGGKSVIGNSSQHGPLTLQQPFYPEDDEKLCHIYLLHPPAGLVGGDKLNLSMTCKNDGAALITTPGATKFYRSDNQFAIQSQVLNINSGCSLEWLPQETIYFPNSRGRQQTRINLENESKFIGWEIHCLGLPANKKDLANGKVDINLTIMRDGSPIVIDGLRIRESKNTYQSAFLRNQPVFGTFIATVSDRMILEEVNDFLKSEILGTSGATIIDGMLIIRYLGPSTTEAKDIFLTAWEIVRPYIIERKSKPPRIWTT